MILTIILLSLCWKTLLKVVIRLHVKRKRCIILMISLRTYERGGKESEVVTPHLVAGVNALVDLQIALARAAKRAAWVRTREGS